MFLITQQLPFHSHVHVGCLCASTNTHTHTHVGKGCESWIALKYIDLFICLWIALIQKYPQFRKLQIVKHALLVVFKNPVAIVYTCNVRCRRKHIYYQI